MATNTMTVSVLGLGPMGQALARALLTQGVPTTVWNRTASRAEALRDDGAGVATDPVLRPLYPEEDLRPAAERLTLFLMQYWGGPNTYSQRRGHPRLRMRHAPFRIGPVERDAWLAQMRRATRPITLYSGSIPLLKKNERLGAKSSMCMPRLR